MRTAGRRGPLDGRGRGRRVHAAAAGGALRRVAPPRRPRQVGRPARGVEPLLVYAGRPRRSADEQSRYGAAIVDAAAGPRGSRNTRALFGGDLNVFPRPDDPFAPGDPLFPSDQLGRLYEEGLENLWDELRRQVPESAYTYVFEGQAQTLDHQFVTRRLERDLEKVRVAHVKADWPADFAGDQARGASDHDPVVSRFAF